MLLYTERRREGHHLLRSYPGYQVDSGQNRKAQCRVEMAQKRRRGGKKDKEKQQYLKAERGRSQLTSKAFASPFVTNSAAFFQ